MHGQENIDNEIYLLNKYIKSVLWRAAKRLFYIEDALCLKVKHNNTGGFNIIHIRLKTII